MVNMDGENDLERVPPSTEEINKRRSELENELSNIRKRKYWFILTVVMVAGPILLGLTVLGTVLTSTIESIVLITLIAMVAIIALSTIFKKCEKAEYATETINNIINDFKERKPLVLFDKVNKITDINSEGTVIKRYVKAAMSQRDFLYEGEYQAIKDWVDAHEDPLKKEKSGNSK